MLAMEAIRINQKLESDTLYLPQLRDLVGQQVEIIVLTESPAARVPSGEPFPLRGSVLRDDDPFGPAVAPEVWEANG